jgi:DNA-binding transcriptional LysR family regulator
MDLRQLRYYVAVAEEGNIGRAATRLCISQPPLTRQIQQLEDHLGVQLFTRTPKGVDLTNAGEMFLEEAQNILSVVEQATERTKKAGAGQLGRLDIGIFGSAILKIIPKILLAFRKQYPDVEVVLHTMDKAEQIEALRQRRIKVGFNRLLTPISDITSETVLKEKLLLAVNEHSPMANMDSVSIKTLEAHPLVLFPTGVRPNFVDFIYKLTNDANIVPQVSQTVGDALTGVALVASGFGVCMVPESATVLGLPGVIYKPINDLPNNAFLDLSCIYLTEDKSPLLKAFMGVVREHELTGVTGQ